MLAVDSAKVRMRLPHFRQKLIERDITTRLVLEVLRHGTVRGQPRIDEFGDWRITMRRKVAGRRINVTVSVCQEYLECVTTW